MKMEEPQILIDFSFVLYFVILVYFHSDDFHQSLQHPCLARVELCKTSTEHIIRSRDGFPVSRSLE